MSRPADVERAYAQGTAVLGRPSGAPAPHALLPAAIAAARTVRTAPSFDALTEPERLALRILLDTLDDHDEPKARYARYRWRISALECELPALRTTPLTRAWLGGLDQRSTRLLTRCVDQAAPIVRHLQATGMPVVDLPPVYTSITNIAWLEAHPDPDLWHQIVGGQGLNPDTEATEQFLRWVIEQPSCDRATAALIFLSCHAVRAPGALSDQLARRIETRSEHGDGFPRTELTLSEFGHPDDQRPLLERLDAGPSRLLGMPYTGRPSRSPYVFHSEHVIETGVSLVSRSTSRS